MSHEPRERTRRQTRARSGMIGGRYPRTGTEPVTARSAVHLRLLLSGVFLPLFAGAAVLFGVWAAHSRPDGSPDRGALLTLASLCAAVTLVAALDLLAVVRRLRRERSARQ
ncbi:DUF6343 family protein [Streptomyces sp. NPDC058755]|uniref:DUF6343 family protein n=1 Tax=Streptomyces sp. NPDC058755 TaxID=3346624 RepID=UPI00368B42E9